MKHIIILLSFFLWKTVVALSPSDIIPTDSPQVVTADTDWFEGLTVLFTYARDSIFALLALVAIWVFLFIGARLVIARWNPEEFKKALNMFIYAAVGLFVVTVAYAAVRMVAWLNF